MIKAIAKMTNRFSPNRISVKDTPKEDISKRSKGMRILALVHRKSSTFEILQPFFNSTPATGSSAYMGTAVIVPDNMATATPFTPEFAPIIRIIFSRSTHTSIRPIQMNTGVSIKRKLIKFFPLKANAVFPISGS